MATKALGLSVAVAHNFASALGDGKDSASLLTKQEWDDLLHRSVSDVVFLTWQWQQVWWRHFGAAAGCQLHLLAVRNEGGALLGIAPLFIASEPLPPAREYSPGQERPEGEGEPRRLVRIVGGADVADYLDIIAAPEHIADVWAAVLDYMAVRRDDWDVIDLHSLPQWSPSREVVAGVAADHGLRAQVFAEDVCPVVELPADWDTYLMSLRKKDRHEIKRKVRKLEGRDDVRWYLVPPSSREAMRKGMQTFLDLHRKSGVDKAHFMNDRMAAFFLDMVRALLDTEWLDLAILEVDKQPASAYFSYNYHGRIYLYNSGYDPKFAAYSAGIALLAYRIHKAINQGCRYFDFLRGDEPYKYDFGGNDSFVYREIVLRNA